MGNNKELLELIREMKSQLISDCRKQSTVFANDEFRRIIRSHPVLPKDAYIVEEKEEYDSLKGRKDVLTEEEQERLAELEETSYFIPSYHHKWDIKTAQKELDMEYPRYTCSCDPINMDIVIKRVE